jgi:integrase
MIQPKAPATINRELTMLKHLFNKCIEWRFAKSNPVKSVQFFREDNGRTRYLNQKEATTLLEACNEDFRIVVLAAMHTGFRKSELKSIRWNSVDFANGPITVESCYAKNGETRSVPMSEDLSSALRALREERKPAADAVVFVSRYGTPWKSLRTAFGNAVERAGLKDFRFHDLRHCFGSWLAMNGVNDKGRMELMGHKDPKMTLRYTHLSMDYKRQAVERLPSFGTAIIEAESQRILQQREAAKVVAFGQ